jgi:hypothetical protein
MATTFATFKKYITPDVMPCPDVIIERELIGTIIDFCKLTHVITKDFNVELDEDDIDSDLQDSIDIDLREHFSDYRPVSVIRINIDGVDYLPLYKEVLNTIDAWDSSVSSGNAKFFFFINNYTVRMYDMNAGDTNLYMRVALKPVRDITEVADEFLYEDHVETISAGVRSKVLGMPGKSWTDINGAKRAFIDWRRGITKARSNFDKGYTNNSQTVHPKSFGDLD